MATTKTTKSEALPLFARSPEAQRRVHPPVSTIPVTPGIAALGLLMATSTALLLFARSDGAQNLPTSSKSRSASSVIALHKTDRATEAKKSEDPALLAQNDSANDASEANLPGRRRLDFYTQEVRGSMFSAPEPPAPKAVAAKPVVKEKPKPPVLPVVPVAPVDPYADWSYKGTITMGDQKIAMLENTKTKEGQYVKAGDTFMGGQVGSITDQQVALTSGGKSYTLAKSDEITITPLSQSANNAPAQPQPQPGQPQPNPGMPQMGGFQGGGPQFWGGGNAQVVLPNGQVLTGGQARRYQRMMNRNFNQ